MSIVCLDTAADEPVVALLGDDHAADRGARGDGQRAQQVLVLVDELLARDGMTPRDVSGVCVGTGPGGFTGLRVGVTTARGLAHALDVPLVEFSSLAAVALSYDDVAAGDTDEVCAGLDARRGEVYVQRFRVTGDAQQLVALGEPQTVAREKLAADVRERTCASWHGVARAARAAMSAAAATGACDAQAWMQVVPRYVRAPDAQPARRSIVVASATAADADALAALDARSTPYPWTREMYAEEFAREDDAVVLLARDEAASGRIVGAALGARIGDAWHVMNVVVEPAARRRGIARMLLTMLMQSEAVSPDEAWTLEVRANNTSARALYESLGFDSAGRRPAYYANGDDADIMWWRPSGGVL